MKTNCLLLIGLLLAGGAYAQESSDKIKTVQGTEENPVLAPNDFLPEGQSENQSEIDPFAASGFASSTLQRIPMARLSEKRNTLQVRVEIWEVSTRDLILAMDGFKGPSALEGWRARILADEKSRLVHAPVEMIEEKSQATTEALAEEIYPTEYEPPEILPEKIVEQVLADKMPETLNELISSMTTGATSTCFETRNTGFTFEAAVHPVSGEAGCWDLSLSIEDIVLQKMNSFGPEALHVTMPVFTAFRTGGLHRVAESRWQLVSAMTSPKASKRESEMLSWVTLVRVDQGR